MPTTAPNPRRAKTLERYLTTRRQANEALNALVGHYQATNDVRRYFSELGRIPTIAVQTEQENQNTAHQTDLFEVLTGPNKQKPLSTLDQLFSGVEDKPPSSAVEPKKKAHSDDEVIVPFQTQPPKTTALKPIEEEPIGKLMKKKMRSKAEYLALIKKTGGKKLKQAVAAFNEAETAKMEAKIAQPQTAAPKPATPSPYKDLLKPIPDLTKSVKTGDTQAAMALITERQIDPATREREKTQLLTQLGAAYAELVTLESANPWLRPAFRELHSRPLARELDELAKIRKLNEKAREEIAQRMHTAPGGVHRILSQFRERAKDNRKAIDARMRALLAQENAGTEIVLYRALKDRQALRHNGSLPTQGHQELTDQYANAAREGRILYVEGQAGTGKSSSMESILREQTIKPPIIIPCHPNITTRELQEAIHTAAHSDVPLLLDEGNTLKPEQQLNLHSVADALAKRAKQLSTLTRERTDVTLTLGDHSPVSLGAKFNVVITGQPADGDTNTRTPDAVRRYDVETLLGRRVIKATLDHPSVDDLERLVNAEVHDPASLKTNFPAADLGASLAQAIYKANQIYADKEPITVTVPSDEPTLHKIPANRKSYDEKSGLATVSAQGLKAPITLGDMRDMMLGWRERGFNPQQSFSKEALAYLRGRNPIDRLVLADLLLRHNLLPEQANPEYHHQLKGVISPKTHEFLSKQREKNIPHK